MRKDEFPIVDKLVKDSINEVLDKIRAEIEEKRPLLYPFVDHKDEYLKRKDVLQIIDKYRKEQE